MVDAIKKMDRKFLIMVGCIIFIPVLIIVLLALIQGCGNRKVTYEKYEDKMVDAATKYFKSKGTPKEEGETKTVELSKLVEAGYIKSTEKLLDDSSCSGNVTVRLNGSIIEENNGGYLNYLPVLKCDKYNTKTLHSELMKNVVKTDSGLYETDIDYVFKGDNVKNYLVMNGNNYRIISVEKDGAIKLLKPENDNSTRIWDNKYNVESKSSDGINFYKDSKILKNLINDYKNEKQYKEELKKRLLSYDVCVGKRSINDMSIDKSIDCSERLENQIVSIMNISDYARASLDTNCTSLTSRSCRNYNYFTTITSSGWSMNAVSDNTYEVFHFSDGIAKHYEANDYKSYKIVLYIDGNERVTSGTGSSSNPYIIE